MNYLEKFSFLTDNQYGFRKKQRFNTSSNFSMETNTSKLESQNEKKTVFLWIAEKRSTQ